LVGANMNFIEKTPVPFSKDGQRYAKIIWDIVIKSLYLLRKTY
jgi:hypothetical protein